MRSHQEHPLEPGRSSDCTISAEDEIDRGCMARIKFAQPNQDWLTCSQDPSTGRTIHAYAPNGIFLKPGFCGSRALPRVAPKPKLSSPLRLSGGPRDARGGCSRAVLRVAGQLREQEIAEDFESLLPPAARQRYPVDNAEWERPIGQQSLQPARGECVAHNEFR